MIYEDKGLKIKSDFEIRTLRENKIEKDLLIDTGGRVLNLFFPKLAPYIKGRIQLTEVSHVLIRYAFKGPKILGLYFMRNIDMSTPLMQVDIDFTGKEFIFTKEEFAASFKLIEGKS